MSKNERFITVTRSDGTQVEVDRTECKIHPVERLYSLRDFHSHPGFRAPLNQRTFYLMSPRDSQQGQFWFERRDIRAHPDSQLPNNGPIYHYAEVEAVSVAHAFLYARQPLPPELERYRAKATGDAYFLWLQEQADRPEGSCTPSKEAHHFFSKYRLAGRIMDVLRAQSPLTEPQIKQALAKTLDCKISDSTLGKTLTALRHCDPPRILNQRSGKDRGYRLAT